MHVDHHGGQWLHIWVVSTTRIVAATCLSSLSNACRLSDQRFIFQAQAKCNLSALHHACIGDIGCHNSFVHGVNRVHQYRMPQLVSLLPRRFCGSDRVRLLGRQCEGPCFNPRLQYHRLKNWVGWWKRCLLQSPTSRKDQYKVTPTYCKDFLLSAARPWKLHWILPCITTMPHNWGNATIPCGRCLCVCLNCSRASDVLCTVLMERLRWVCCQSLEGMSVVDAGNFTVVCRYEFAVGDEVDSSSHAEIVQERFVYFNDMFHLRMRFFFLAWFWWFSIPQSELVWALVLVFCLVYAPREAKCWAIPCYHYAAVADTNTKHQGWVPSRLSTSTSWWCLVMQAFDIIMLLCFLRSFVVGGSWCTATKCYCAGT